MSNTRWDYSTYVLRRASAGDVDSAQELLRRDRRTFASALRAVRRFVQDDGISYAPDSPDGAWRPWRIDPLPEVISRREWNRLERGLQQRAAVLRLVFDDLYGEQHLLRDGLLPAAAILSHPGYLRPARGVPAAHRPLLLTAADLGRDEAGDWTVLEDRVQAPAGVGYAMATRRIIARILPRLHRETELSSLLGFFRTVSSALRAAAPATEAAPRVAQLSPGPLSDNAFDDAYLAALIGVPLLEADDVVVRDGKPWMRGSHGLVPVDVILRRVDESWTDPLELRGESQLGVPGLLEASRTGQATVVNPIGAGVLEHGAIVAAFPQLTRHLLGEDALLPSPATWWCGHAADRRHVLARLGELILKSAGAEEGVRLVQGWTLSAAERDELRARIEARPWAWVGQEPLPLSSSPMVTDDGLQERCFVLRTFGVQLGDEHVLMRGGLGRLGKHPEDRTITGLRDVLAKDVWVLGPEPDDGYPWLTIGGSRVAGQAPVPLFETTPRGADNLYWFGRYTERADGATRLLAVANDLAADHVLHPDTPGAVALQSVLAAMQRLIRVREPAEGESMVGYLRHLVADPSPGGTIGALVERLVRSAQNARELISGDTWAVLADLERAVAEVPADADELQPHFDALLVPLLALQGITAHGMFRDTTWAFVDIGVRLERAQFVAGLLPSVFVPAHSPVVEFHIAEAVLAVGDSTISHRRRMALADGPDAHVAAAIDLLVVERGNPHSLAFQLERIAANLQLIGDEPLAERAHSLLAQVTGLDPQRAGAERELLGEALGAAGVALRELSDTLSAHHFRRQAPRIELQERWSALGRGLR